MNDPIRVLAADDLLRSEEEPFLTREWLVANGLGGYAAGTIASVATRRYHGLLIAALPAPFGRHHMLSGVTERLRLPNGNLVALGGSEQMGRPLRQNVGALRTFRLERGLPVWKFHFEGAVLERSVLMPHLENSVYVRLRLLEGGPLRVSLRPLVRFRPHDAPVSSELGERYAFTARDDRYELTDESSLPPLRFRLEARRKVFTFDGRVLAERRYRVEEDRGYPFLGAVWTPGYFRADVAEGESLTLVASTESWDRIGLVPSDAVFSLERERRERLLAQADPRARAGMGAELVLAADSFIIAPAGRPGESARAKAAGDDPRTVIAGYHWFTDWGRDTMISLEGLALATGRFSEAGAILRAFALAFRDGLIPNLYPEGEEEGLYHTADATLWFFHALDRYVRATGDTATLASILPRLYESIEWHLRGTRFGIGVDQKDGLLRQGEAGYALTWMDARMGDWVVTPRRGKAVEINALWYNALRVLASWAANEGSAERARQIQALADRVHRSFNERFWYERGGYLYDVVDGDSGDDPACRPNQLFAVALPHPVLDRSRWRRLVALAEERLVTPVGLRSLSPEHPDYKPRYFGDLRSRDAAYHQGTVWGWLIGPFLDAWLKVHPGDREGARSMLEGFSAHLSEACIGQISEVFDAQSPFTPRGCVAQAWSVAEVLRCWVATSPEDP
jgi:predicted glycogen debranching enzyme